MNDGIHPEILESLDKAHDGYVLIVCNRKEGSEELDVSMVYQGDMALVACLASGALQRIEEAIEEDV